LVLEPQVAGALVFEGTAGAEQIDSDTADNSVTMTVTSIAVADLVLSGRANRSAMNTGDNVTVSLTVTNVGPLASGAFSITGQLPTGVSFVTGNGCALASGAVTCTANSLAYGASRTFDMVLTATTTGTKTTSVSLTTDTKDPVPSNDSATISFSVSSPPSGGGGGGCVSNPDAPFDPTLIILLALAMAGLLARQCAARYGRA
jgi:uncharacterized repeat protein (TIGR01451 family)